MPSESGRVRSDLFSNSRPKYSFTVILWVDKGLTQIKYVSLGENGDIETGEFSFRAFH